jgi:hypothetical protein
VNTKQKSILKKEKIHEKTLKNKGPPKKFNRDNAIDFLIVNRHFNTINTAVLVYRSLQTSKFCFSSFVHQIRAAVSYTYALNNSGRIHSNLMLVRTTIELYYCEVSQ